MKAATVPAPLPCVPPPPAALRPSPAPRCPVSLSRPPLPCVPVPAPAALCPCPGPRCPVPCLCYTDKTGGTEVVPKSVISLIVSRPPLPCAWPRRPLPCATPLLHRQYERHGGRPQVGHLAHRARRRCRCRSGHREVGRCLPRPAGGTRQRQRHQRVLKRPAQGATHDVQVN